MLKSQWNRLVHQLRGGNKAVEEHVSLYDKFAEPRASTRQSAFGNANQTRWETTSIKVWAWKWPRPNFCVL